MLFMKLKQCIHLDFSMLIVPTLKWSTSLACYLFKLFNFQCVFDQKLNKCIDAPSFSMWPVVSFFIYYFFKLFYHCSITVVCIFSPSSHPSQTHLPPLLPPSLLVLSYVLYSSSWKPFSPLSPPQLLLDCS